MITQYTYNWVIVIKANELIYISNECDDIKSDICFPIEFISEKSRKYTTSTTFISYTHAHTYTTERKIYYQ